MKNTIKNFIELNKMSLGLFSVLIIVIVYFEAYNFLYPSFSSVSIFYLRKTEYWKKKIAIFKKDQETIKNHWDNDRDLVYLTKFCRVCWLLGLWSLSVCFILLYTHMLDMESYMHISLNMNIVERFTAINSFFLHFGVCSLLFGSIMSFCGEIHIIFFRNSPTIEQIASLGWKTLKYTLPVIPPTLLGLDVLSSIPWIPPTYFGTQWQIYCGRGYGYEDSATQLQIQALEFSHTFKPKTLANNSSIITKDSVHTFIEEHKEELLEELPLHSLLVLNLKKSLLPGVFGK